MENKTIEGSTVAWIPQQLANSLTDEEYLDLATKIAEESRTALLDEFKEVMYDIVIEIRIVRPMSFLVDYTIHYEMDSKQEMMYNLQGNHPFILWQVSFMSNLHDECARTCS